MASVAFADEMVGRTLQTLNESSYKNNTIVVLFSDHGYNLGEKNFLFKYCLWEETTRVPLLLKAASYAKNVGRQVSHPVSLIDIYPTLQELCKLEGSTVFNAKGKSTDGHSLVPFLENPKNHTWEGSDIAITVITSWKSKKAKEQHLAARSERYRYIHYLNGMEELYDHKKDP